MGTARQGNKKVKNPQKVKKDFVKVKNKVGKRKKLPANEQRTNVKIGSVRMPAQSMMSIKGEEVTHRKLGLHELLAQTTHHSATTRRDAFHGLKELCQMHDGVLQNNLSSIFDATVTAPIDASAKVREAFHHFQRWMIDKLPADMFFAFGPNLSLHLRSALSHVNKQVREDGLVLLEMYMSQLADTIVLTSADIVQLINTLAQWTSKAASVLPCLLKLVQFLFSQSDHGAKSSQKLQGTMLQCSLKTVLDGKFHDSTVSESVTEHEQVSVDSPIWSFCVDAWVQANTKIIGLRSNPGRKEGEAAAKPSLMMLQCTAVWEKLCESSNAGIAEMKMLQPSAQQIRMLAGMARREEWPVSTAQLGSRSLANTVNLRMARIFAHLGAETSLAQTSEHHLAQLLSTSLTMLHQVVESLGSTDGYQSAAEAAAAVAASPVEKDTEKGALSNVAAAAHALRSLSLLWFCASNSTAEDGLSKGHASLLENDVKLLASVTTRVALGMHDVGVTSPTTILAVPLVAALLGITSVGVVTKLPDAMRQARPIPLDTLPMHELFMQIEKIMPGTAVAWISAWPKLLWHLGNSDIPLSSYLISLLLEIGKRGMKADGFHAGLIKSTWAFLAPFFVGLPGTDKTPPPIALLPADDTEGSQALAAALLPHFPKLTPSFIIALTRLLCHWFHVTPDTTLTSAGRLGAVCSTLVMETILKSPQLSVQSPLRLRLQAALTVLCASSEQASLHLADLIANWLMSEEVFITAGIATVGTYDDSRRLALQTLAWPLCLKIIAKASGLALRAFVFLFYCSARLPVDGYYTLDLDWLAFLHEIFHTFVMPKDDSAWFSPLHLEVFATSIYDTNHMRGLSSAVPHRCPAAMFVAIWMCAVPSTQKAIAYELLVKLCAQQLLSIGSEDAFDADVCRSALVSGVATNDSGGVSEAKTLGSPSEDQVAVRVDAMSGVVPSVCEDNLSFSIDGCSVFGSSISVCNNIAKLDMCALVLASIITYRSDRCLCMNAWGSHKFSFNDGLVLDMAMPEDICVELEKLLQRWQTRRLTQGLRDLSAVLHLL